MMRYLLAYSFFMMLTPLAAQQAEFEAVGKKPLWPDSSGTLVISDRGIEFRQKDKDEARHWTYQDIQYLDRVSPTEIVLLTYEDAPWRLGRDRQYRFVLTSGAISDELFERISSRLQRPVTDRVIDDAPETAERLAVKHLHTFGGCEGELVFGESAVFYVTEHAKDAREWKIDRDIDSV